jgi:hypothetical protein
MGIDSVHGPDNGQFAFWEAGATEPTEAVGSGSTGTRLWALSESDGSPDSDPFGHIHGRRFTADRPGLYRVGFRLFDTSTHGTGSGPIHTPSDVLFIHFQAGITITSIVWEAGAAAVTFGAPAQTSLTLEATTNLTTEAGWSPVAEPVAGNDRFQTILDPDAADRVRIYRVREDAP